MSDLERDLEQSWIANAGAWTEAVRSGRIESRVVASNDAIINAVLELQPKRVLDVGCGEGWLSHRIAEAGIDVAGFDSNAELIERARERGLGSFSVLDYGAFSADPRRAGADFDVAICNFSLLGKDIGPVIRACATVLVPGGRLIVQTVHPFTDIADARYENAWRNEDFTTLGPAFTAHMPWYFRTVGAWIRELTTNGFALAECREPVHPETGKPVSLLLIATKTGTDPRTRELLRHFLAALAYRTQKALREAPAAYADFAAGSDVRTPRELVRHMASVLGYARTFFVGGAYWPDPLDTWDAEIDRLHAIISDLAERIERGEQPGGITPLQLLQGPFADAMTHAGQLAMLRRLAGSPVESENFIFADVSAANLTRNQPLPVASTPRWMGKVIELIWRAATLFRR